MVIQKVLDVVVVFTKLLCAKQTGNCHVETMWCWCGAGVLSAGVVLCWCRADFVLVLCSALLELVLMLCWKLLKFLFLRNALMLVLCVP